MTSFKHQWQQDTQVFIIFDYDNYNFFSHMLTLQHRRPEHSQGD